MTKIKECLLVLMVAALTAVAICSCGKNNASPGAGGTQVFPNINIQ